MANHTVEFINGDSKYGVGAISTDFQFDFCRRATRLASHRKAVDCDVVFECPLRIVHTRSLHVYR